MIAAAISIITAVLMMFGVTVSPVDQEILVNAGVIIASALASIFFRYIAKTDLQAMAPLVPPDTKAVDPIEPIVIKD